ncbi:hypothetical protein D3C81_1560920 [compost metagenome]
MELQVCRLSAGVDFTRPGRRLVASDAGLQLRLMGGFGRCSAFAGDQRLRANLRRLHTVIRIGGAGGWMNGFDHRGQNLYAAVECL